MAITSESQIIDITTISNGCSIIEEAARDYATCSKKVKEAASICTDKALSVEKKSMQPSLEELGESIGTIQGNIEYFTFRLVNCYCFVFINIITTTTMFVSIWLNQISICPCKACITKLM